ncbi:hypothetical protein AB1Y20_006058 [Prymnesium parvum]|uniref:Serine/threonine-protein kinase RIO1 n=1 Tax=Prymnesium parvum TaxID=97485 RepID=A0AB34J1M0_PRYPA
MSVQVVSGAVEQKAQQEAEMHATPSALRGVSPRGPTLDGSDGPAHTEGSAWLHASAAAEASEDEYDEDEWDESWDDAWGRVQGDHSVHGGGSTKSDSLSSKFDSLVRLDKLSSGVGGGIGEGRLSQAAENSLSRTERKIEQAKHQGLTRDERATTDQVLDPRTRMILFKMINSGTIESINGCVSTGKEANVYHAFGPECELAIKVYKTSILIFKDRDRYVSGEFRFRHGYCKSNPRKMVKMWAEKEMRNYRRLALAKVPCPEVLLLREHVLVMKFIGHDGFAAPRLKDAKLSLSQATHASVQVALLLRSLYHDCRLVHGDFSEYNLLWYDEVVYVIDVSQSVEHDHPNALAFLRKDCENTIIFFRKEGVARLPNLQGLFDFVTAGHWDVAKGSEEAAYERLLEKGSAVDRPSGFPDSVGAVDGAAGGVNYKLDADEEIDAQGIAAAAEAEASVREAVFAQMHIPRTLEEIPVKQIERDLAAARRGEEGSMNTSAYSKMMGLTSELGSAQAPIGASERAQYEANKDEDVSGEESDECSDEESDEGEEGEEGEEGVRRRGRRRVLHRDEDKDAKRERKAAVKEAQRAARKVKTPKHVKKRATKGNKK